MGGSQFTSGPGFNNFGRTGDNWEMLEGVVTGGGFPGVYYDFTAFDEAQVQVLGNGAEIPGSGVWVNGLVKSGGNTFNGSGFYALTGPKLQSNNIDEELRVRGVTGSNRLASRYDFNGDIGGRIVPNKLWFYGGGAPGVGRADHDRCRPSTRWQAWNGAPWAGLLERQVVVSGDPGAPPRRTVLAQLEVQHPRRRSVQYTIWQRFAASHQV